MTHFKLTSNYSIILLSEALINEELINELLPWSENIPDYVKTHRKLEFRWVFYNIYVLLIKILVTGK